MTTRKNATNHSKFTHELSVRASAAIRNRSAALERLRSIQNEIEKSRADFDARYEVGQVETQELLDRAHATMESSRIILEVWHAREVALKQRQTEFDLMSEFSHHWIQK